MEHAALSCYGKLAKQAQRIGLLLGFTSLIVVVGAQAPGLSQPSARSLTPEAAATRKAAVQVKLGELEQANLSEEELAEARDRLVQLVAALTVVEEAAQRRDTYGTQRANLPQRLDEAAASRKQLQERSRPQFPNVTESLRAEYDAQRRALEAELSELAMQATAEGGRQARLSEDVQTHTSALESNGKSAASSIAA